MQIFPRRWNMKTKIEYLQRKIILNSIAYYELNTNKLTDKQYDELSRQLVAMQAEYPNIMETQYGYVFYDFDGSTGFDLYHRLNKHDKEYLYNIACHVCNDIKSIKQAKPKPVKKKKGVLF